MEGMNVDPEVAKAADKLALFVVKHGLEFEERVKREQVNNPLFRFLLGGPPGSTNAASATYYAWKKRHLAFMLSNASVGQQVALPSVPIKPSPGHVRSAPPVQHALEDVDMEGARVLVRPPTATGRVVICGSWQYTANSCHFVHSTF